MNIKTFKLRSVALYYQTEREAGVGNAGWAYNVIDSEGEHTSDGFEIGERDDGSEALSAVREAFALNFERAAQQVTRWDVTPEGGWIGRP